MFGAFDAKIRLQNIECEMLEWCGRGGPRTTEPHEGPKIQVCHPHERGSIDFSCRGLTYDILDSEKLHPRDIRPDTPSLSSRNVRKPAQKAANPGFQPIFDFQSPIS